MNLLWSPPLKDQDKSYKTTTNIRPQVQPCKIIANNALCQITRARVVNQRQRQRNVNQLAAQIKKLIRGWDSERELYLHDIVHVALL